MLLRLRASANNDRGPLYGEQAFAAIHQANVKRLPLGLILGSHQGGVGLFLVGDDRLQSIIEAQFYAQYPDCALDRLPDDLPKPSEGAASVTASMALVPDLFPCRRHSQFEDPLNRVTADPLTGILSALARLERDGFEGRVEFVARPAGRRRITRARHCLRGLSHPFFRSKPRLAQFYAEAATSPRRSRRIIARLLSLPTRKPSEQSRYDPTSVSASRLHDREDDLQAAADKLGRLLFEARLTVSLSFPTSREKEATRRLGELAGALGHFSSPRGASFVASRPTKRKPRESWFLLSTEELATLFHPPNHTVRGSSVARVQSRELEPPTALRAQNSRPDIVCLGLSQFRDERHDVTLAIDDRRRHLAILGKTGTGKTTLLENLIVADIRAGRGVAVVDPHGDLADSLLALIPRGRTNDVIAFDVADTEHPLSFNPLDCHDTAQRPLVASAVLSAFKKLYSSMWGPRLEHIFRNALLALVETHGASLAQVLPLLIDRRFREGVVRQVSDSAVRRFWEQEFATMPPRLQGEAIAPVLNKIGHFISSPLLRNIVGQPRTTLNMRAAMDRGAILIVNLSKGRIGEDASALLGALVVTSLQLAAMSRANVPESERRDFFAYIDEFSNFATESFASIFSEARKYRLGLTVATQFIEQLDEMTQGSLFGNVGTTIAFQSSQRDAEVLAVQLGGDLLPADLLTLPKFHAYVRLLIDGVPSQPFSMRTLSPDQRRGDEQSPEVVRRASRHRYTRERGVVERKLAAALGRPTPDANLRFATAESR